MRRCIAILSCLLVIAFVCTNVFGASGTGTVAGKVCDPKGVAAAGATVRLVNAGGTTIRQATTNTGLQEDVGPWLNRFMVVSVPRNFTHGAFYVSYAQEDARDRTTGEPVQEARRCGTPSLP